MFTADWYWETEINNLHVIIFEQIVTREWSKD